MPARPTRRFRLAGLSACDWTVGDFHLDDRAATVTEADFRGLRKLQAAAGVRFRCGAVLYDGEHALRFGPGLHAVPNRALWDTRKTVEQP